MKNIVVLFCVMLALNGCMGSFKSKMGLSSTTPNEQVIPTLKPLHIPQKFDLPEPQPCNKVDHKEEGIINTPPKSIPTPKGYR